MKDKVIKRLRFDNIQSEVFDKSEYNDGVFMYGKLSTSQSISVLVHPSINNIIF